jgi:DNA polymerase IIIc chi subunit
MSTKTRVAQAMKKLDRPGLDWTHKSWESGGELYISLESERSAQLLSEALWMIFKSQRRQLIHNGRKP